MKRCVYNHGDLYLFRFSYTYTNYPSSGGFRARQKCPLSFPDACLFGHPFYFDYKDFISLTSEFSFQRFNAGKLWKVIRNVVTD